MTENDSFDRHPTATDPGLPESIPSAAASGDVVADPAKDDSGAGDWTDEGGATTEGPATDTDG